MDLTGIHKVLISPDSPFGLSGSGDLIGILILESQRFPAFAGQEANTSNARILLGEDPDYGNGLWQIRNKLAPIARGNAAAHDDRTSCAARLDVISEL